MTGRVDVVIVNWNAGRQLEACLASLAGAPPGIVSSATVVDNGSSDGSLDGLGALGFPLKVVRLGENLGFGAACNRGAREGSAERLLFLNPDARLLPGALEALARCLDEKSAAGVGIVGPRLVDDGGRTARSCARFPSLIHWLNEGLGLSRLSPGAFPGLFLSDWDHGDSRGVDHVMGACWLMPRRLFEALGGFDEAFFMYLEDLDLSLRARRAGKAAYFLAEATVYHKGGGTSERVRDRRLFYSLRSRLIYARKHLGRRRAAFLAAVTLTVEFALRLARGLGTGATRETLSGYGMLWRWLLGGRS